MDILIRIPHNCGHQDIVLDCIQKWLREDLPQVLDKPHYRHKGRDCWSTVYLVTYTAGPFAGFRAHLWAAKTKHGISITGSAEES